MTFSFTKLNDGWNAEPNAPDPSINTHNENLTLKFLLNAFQFTAFQEEEIGFITFKNCSQYRLGPTNDEGWYKGQCRFSKLLPEWGEFYELSGDAALLDAPNDWKKIKPITSDQKHYLFYFRDDTFECVADSWEFSTGLENALLKLISRIE